MDLERELQVKKQKEISRIKNLLKDCKYWNELSCIQDLDWREEAYVRTKMGDTEASPLGDIVFIAELKNIKLDKLVSALEFKFLTLPKLIRQST